MNAISPINSVASVSLRHKLRMPITAGAKSENNQNNSQSHQGRRERRATPRPDAIPNPAAILRRGPLPTFVAHVVGAYLLPKTDLNAHEQRAHAYQGRNETGRLVSRSA